MTMVAVSSLAAGLSQNGVFAYVSGFGVADYTQAIMTGQAVAGVLPCVAQIAAVLSVPAKGADDGGPQESPQSAFAYFLTATVVSTLALLTFLFLVKRRPEDGAKALDESDNDGHVDRREVDMRTLFEGLPWLALAVFLTFAITMMYPVFTQAILSVQPDAARIYQPASFIPLGFLVWNVGDLIGRLATLVPFLSLARSPRLVFMMALARIVFIPLYFLCNIHGRGAVIVSDLFYLGVLQLLFGATSGFFGVDLYDGRTRLGGTGAERKLPAGSMSLCLVGGLSVGSLFSFIAAYA